MVIKNLCRKAYWIFDDRFILPTYLSVVSFLQYCDIPVVLVFYGNKINEVKRYFASLISKRIVTIDYKTDNFFQLPVLPYNKAFESTIRNRELRFYVAALSGQNEVVYCFDSDIIFTESVKDLLSIDFGEQPTICGCIEQEHTYDNKLYFERGILHLNTQHIYPEQQKEEYDRIFEEDSSWLSKPQYNNGVLVFYNARDLAEQWRKEHLRGLYNPIVNPGEDQVTLTAAIYKTENIKRVSIPSRYNSMGQLTGYYAVFHATGGQWIGEIINAVLDVSNIKDSLSDCAKVYRRIIRELKNKEILNDYSLPKSSPFLYHAIKGYFFFKPAYSYIFTVLPEKGTFVEIGTYQGKSICYMAELVKYRHKMIKLYSIDNYCNIGYSYPINYETALENLSHLGISEYVTLLKNDSLQALHYFPDNSIDGVFLDGDYRYENVLLDLNCWYEKIKNGGILAGNNYTRISSVREAVDKFCAEKCIHFSILEQSFIILVNHGI